MTKGLPRSMARAAPQAQALRRQRVKLNDLAIRTSGASGVGFGSAVIGDLPAGNILFQGAIAYLQFTKLDAGTTATFDGDFSVGTTATADATLSTTDANIIGSSALGAATAGLSPVVRGEGATQAMLDNTDGSLELNLNLIIDDAAVSADDQDFTVDGYVDLIYAVLGDD
jgi:hypothetical protein